MRPRPRPKKFCEAEAKAREAEARHNEAEAEKFSLEDLTSPIVFSKKSKQESCAIAKMTAQCTL